MKGPAGWKIRPPVPGKSYTWCGFPKKTGEKNLISAAHKALAVTYQKMKKWDMAIEHFRKSIENVDEETYPYYTADFHFDFGLMYKEKGDLRKAREHIQIAKEIWAKIGSTESVGDAEEALKGL